MLDEEDIKRYNELSAKAEEELTDEEYKELLSLQHRDMEEMCTTMAQYGI